MNCQTCDVDLAGRKRKYCSKACYPSFKRPGIGLANCQHCGKPLNNIIKSGRPKRNCSDYCRNTFANRVKKPPAPIVQSNCQLCGNSFKSRAGIRFCSVPCRLVNSRNLSKARKLANRKDKYPDGMVTVTCGWCDEPRTYPVGTSTPTAFHLTCRTEAQRARYRIKTVKRQGLVTKPSRLAADEVVRTYGNNCAVCSEPIDLTLLRTNKMGLTVDHWIPLSKGGSDDLSNLRPAHWICNLKKSNSIPKETNA